MTTSDLLTSGELEDILGMTRRTINRHAKAGKIPARKLPGRTGQYLFSRDVIDLLVALKEEQS